MQIFKNILSKNKGSAAIVFALVFSSVTALWMVSHFDQVRIIKKSFLKSKRDSLQLMTGHAMAALLKQELLDNFENLKATKPSCLGASGNALAFLAFLDSPGSFDPTCSNEVFQFKRFENGLGENVVPVSLLRAANSVLKPTVEFSTPFETQIRISSFELDRNRIVGNVSFSNHRSLATPSTSLTNDRRVTFFIDIQRTLAANVPDPACRICRTEPGGVCCDYAKVISLMYLESGSARIMKADYDGVAKILISIEVGPARYPTAVSIKNVDLGLTVYQRHSFKVTGNSPEIFKDTAQDPTDDFFLSHDGRILKKDGAYVLRDPKLRSLSYTEGVWYFLRSDGRVLTSNDLSSSTFFVATEMVLDRADKLVSGAGTTDNY